MGEPATRAARAKEPSHQAIIDVIEVKVGEINRRLDGGERRFDRIEKKMDIADESRTRLAEDVNALQVSVERLRATEEGKSNPPWWLQWQPVAIGLTLAVFAGAGLTALTIAGLDILPKLSAIKAAVGATTP